MPRVRDRATNTEVALQPYAALQQPRAIDQALMRTILGGVSTREYGRCVSLIPSAFGLSWSTISRLFQCATRRRLRALHERWLGGEQIVAVVLDGKTFAADAMVVAVGVWTTGEKRILGFVQTATENRVVCADFLRSLLARGLCIEHGLLVVIDGSKGLRAAVAEAFGARGIVQRCQWHKRENVMRYLPPQHQRGIRKKLQAVYEQPTYERAKKALQQVRREVALLNLSAAGSLDEGCEETLTLHRLGCFRTVGVSLKTTNHSSTSIHARIAQPHRHKSIDWSNQRVGSSAGLATALLEPRASTSIRIKTLVSALPALQRAFSARRSRHNQRSSLR